MTIAKRILARPWLVGLLGFVALCAMVVVLLVAWLGYGFVKQRRMARELDEAKLVEITHCGDRILVALDDYRREHGEFPTELSEIDLTACEDALAGSARFGDWAIQLSPVRPDSVTLVFAFGSPWVRATNWHHLTSGLTEMGPESWVATRLTPYSTFPDDLHHMQRAAPELESRYGVAQPPRTTDP